MEVYSFPKDPTYYYPLSEVLLRALSELKDPITYDTYPELLEAASRSLAKNLHLLPKGHPPDGNKVTKTGSSNQKEKYARIKAKAKELKVLINGLSVYEKTELEQDFEFFLYTYTDSFLMHLNNLGVDCCLLDEALEEVNKDHKKNGVAEVLDYFSSFDSLDVGESGQSAYKPFVYDFCYFATMPFILKEASDGTQEFILRSKNESRIEVSKVKKHILEIASSVIVYEVKGELVDKDASTKKTRVIKDFASVSDMKKTVRTYLKDIFDDAVNKCLSDFWERKPAHEDDRI